MGSCFRRNDTAVIAPGLRFAVADPPHQRGRDKKERATSTMYSHRHFHRVPKLVDPNSALWVEGCERQYCGGA